MRTILVLVALGSGGLLVVGWLGWLHPAFDSVGHFRLHIAAVAVPIMLLLALRHMYRTLVILGWVCALSLALTWPALPGLSPAEDRADFVVAQQNLLFLNKMPERAALVLKATGADVLLLQEVSLSNGTVLRRLAERYPHRTVCRFRKFRGVAILSRTPFVGEAECQAESGLASARVEVAGQLVAFASMHTYWPWPYRQWSAVEAVDERLRKLPHPLVVGGDFNASPWSALVAKVAKTTRTQVIPGLRFTWNLNPLSRGDSRFGGLPLDHVLSSPDLEARSATPLPDAGSDHLGTRVGFKFVE